MEGGGGRAAAGDVDDGEEGAVGIGAYRGGVVHDGQRVGHGGIAGAEGARHADGGHSWRAGRSGDGEDDEREEEEKVKEKGGGEEVRPLKTGWRGGARHGAFCQANLRWKT